MLKPAPLRHFLDLDQYTRYQLADIIRFAHLLKKQNRFPRDELKGKTLALIFEKPSTRTRVSFEVAMRELGGESTTLTGTEIQMGHGETLADTARVLSRFVHVIMLRTFAHEDLQTIAKYATVPVINGLTNLTHPCQVMADLMTLEEKLHRIEGQIIAWVGDGDNNVLNSWMQAAALFNFELRIACPEKYAPDKEHLAKNARAKITVTRDPAAAVQGAAVVITDTWISMHHEDAEERREALAPYQVNTELMMKARKDAIFLHCLPAHRGEEVTDAVMDGAQSAVWDEAENRLHIQKAILMFLLNKIPQV